MFLREEPLKRMMKEAFKGAGLIIANKGEVIYIAGSYWAIDIERKHLPKTILAKIIELAGELPEVGESFEATKGGNQMLAGGTNDVAIGGAAEELHVTNVVVFSIYGIPQRVLQNGLNAIVLVTEAVMGMICKNAVDTSRGEEEPIGPLYVPGKGLFWANNVMRFRVVHRTVDNEDTELIGNLEGIKLWQN